MPFTFAELRKRRVFQIVGLYLGASFAMIEFLDWLTSRFPVTPFLPEIGFVLLAAMLPTICMLAWFHGRPGPDQLVAAEKIGIPLNMVLAVGLLLMLYHDKNLGSPTTQVEITDDSGAKVVREVARAEFRERLMVFAFDNKSGTEDLGWMEQAIADMTTIDLVQNPYLVANQSYLKAQEFLKAGYPEYTGVPLPLKQRIARDSHFESFLAGSIVSVAGPITVDYAVYDTASLRPRAQGTLSADRLAGVVDALANVVKQALEVPAYQIEGTLDLPAAEIFTQSEEALESLYRGVHLILVKRDWPAATALIEAAAELDPTCAYCWMNLTQTYGLNSQREQQVAAFENLMKYLYKLPELAQFTQRYAYFFAVKQQPEMADRVLANWATLYPDLPEPYILMGTRRMQNAQTAEAIEAFETAVAIDPAQTQLLTQIGDLHASAGDLVRARDYHRRYSDAHPDDVQGLRNLADVELKLGQFVAAEDYYHQALAMDPQNVSTLLAMARMQADVGQYANAETHLADAQAMASEAEATAVLAALEGYHHIRGQPAKALEYGEQKLAIIAEQMPGAIALIQRMEYVDQFVKAGREEEARAFLAEAEATLQPPLDGILGLGFATLYLETGELERVAAELEKLDPLINQMQIGMLRPPVLKVGGRAREAMGDLEGAVALYREALALAPTNVGARRRLGRCLTAMGEYDEAESLLGSILVSSPMAPKTNLEMARLRLAQGQHDGAREHLSHSLAAWEKADPGFKPLEDAQALAGQLQ